MRRFVVRGRLPQNASPHVRAQSSSKARDARHGKARTRKERADIVFMRGGICSSPWTKTYLPTKPASFIITLHVGPWLVGGVSIRCPKWYHIYIYIVPIWLVKIKIQYYRRKGIVDALKFKWHTQTGCPDICRRWCQRTPSSANDQQKPNKCAQTTTTNNPETNHSEREA